MSTRVAVIGAGRMGAAIVRVLLSAGHLVTVWNRTASRCEPLHALGAAVADTPARALVGAELLITITSRCGDLEPILGDPSLSTAGRDVVNLVTGTPQETTALQARVRGSGGRFLNGTIQCFPPDIGSASAMLLLAGDPAVWERRQALLRQLGGASMYLGEPAALPNVFDASITGGFVFGAEAAFLESARFAAAMGIDIETYGRFAELALDALRGLLQRHVAAIAAGDFGEHGATLESYRRANLVFNRAFEDAGAPALLLAANGERMQAALDAGDGDKSLTALYLH